MTIIQIWLHEVHNNSFTSGNIFIGWLQLLSPSHSRQCNNGLDMCGRLPAGCVSQWVKQLSTTPLSVWGAGCIDQHFLDLGTSWRGMVNFTLRLPYPLVKEPLLPLGRRLGEPQSRCGLLGGERILDRIGTLTWTPQSSSP
jgi:hypothetical protein